MDLHLNGKNAIVTGASQGIGRAIAKSLAQEGVQLFITARSRDLLESLSDEIVKANGKKPYTFSYDFPAEDGPQKIAEAALSSLGNVDILVNNVGRSRAVDVVGPEEEWKAGMAMDFDRHRQLTQAILPHFIKRTQGSILNITSTYELRSVNVSAVAKAGITAWSKQLAGQLGKYNIRVNCLQPGLIDTANTRRIFSEEEKKSFAQQEIPLGKFGEPEDMANMATFMVSPRAKYITGSVVVVDGGLRHYAF